MREPTRGCKQFSEIFTSGYVRILSYDPKALPGFAGRHGRRAFRPSGVSRIAKSGRAVADVASVVHTSARASRSHTRRPPSGLAVNAAGIRGKRRGENSATIRAAHHTQPSAAFELPHGRIAEIRIVLQSVRWIVLRTRAGLPSENRISKELPAGTGSSGTRRRWGDPFGLPPMAVVQHLASTTAVPDNPSPKYGEKVRRDLWSNRTE
jgi:hypothetical protein